MNCVCNPSAKKSFMTIGKDKQIDYITEKLLM
jgi:hypothetical protein